VPCGVPSRASAAAALGIAMPRTGSSRLARQRGLLSELRARRAPRACRTRSSSQRAWKPEVLGLARSQVGAGREAGVLAPALRRGADPFDHDGPWPQSITRMYERVKHHGQQEDRCLRLLFRAGWGASADAHHGTPARRRAARHERPNGGRAIRPVSGFSFRAGRARRAR
jgi:hypothetical protein